MYTVFTMGGTVALRSVNQKFTESYSSAAKQMFAIFLPAVGMKVADRLLLVYGYFADVTYSF